MRILLLMLFIGVVAACGIKRELVLPCDNRYHKNTPDNGTAPAPKPTPASTEPCVNNQVQPSGELLAPATQTPPVPGVTPVSPGSAIGSDTQK